MKELPAPNRATDDELAGLYRRLGAPIYRRCEKLLGDGAAAQDATQEVFIKLMNHKEHLDPTGDYMAWVYRVATNHCLNVIRDEARLALCAPEHMPDAGAVGAAAHYPERDLSVRLLRRFDEITQGVALLSLVDGLSQDEVAEVLGVSRKTVGKKLRNFLDKAQRFITRST